ncbi:hypothetical protein ACHQM5_025672 [Ranunculus cassubicifolius]
MALDIVLRGDSSIRLAAMLSSMHGESIAKMVHSAIDTENKIRGGDSWVNVEYLSSERQANMEVFSNTMFELPQETLAAGDEIAATLAPAQAVTTDKEEQLQIKAEESPAEKDPFAASDALNKPDELVGGFKKNKESSANDLSTALAGIDMTTLPPAEATQSTHIGVEGFEGNYGGIEFNLETTLNEAFETFNPAWGGGLDPSEFVESDKVKKIQLGLGGLKALQSGQPDPAAISAKGTGSAEKDLVKKTEMKGPELYISEEISVEFRESLLARVGLMGIVYVRTLPPKTSGNKETEFSFKVDGTSGVKSLGNGMFHLRTAAADEPLPILKYSLLPRATTLPLRVRLIKRHIGTILAGMIQYSSNPDLPVPACRGVEEYLAFEFLQTHVHASSSEHHHQVHFQELGIQQDIQVPIV